MDSVQQKLSGGVIKFFKRSAGAKNFAFRAPQRGVFELEFTANFVNGPANFLKGPANFLDSPNPLKR